MDNNSNLFETYREDEQNFYNESRAFLINNRSCIEESEHYIADLLYDFVLSKKEEIERDYNAASILYPFWKNYPPEDRGRQPIGDQIPWIEVGERVLGTKLTRFLSTKFDTVLDTGIPSGADDRFVLAHDDIKTKLQISNSIWLFTDIKSVGPRDDADHAVMSPYQISGDGIWENLEEGVKNTVLTAKGKRTSHEFHCAIPPLYLIDKDTIALTCTAVLKPVYKMLRSKIGTPTGQPLDRIEVVVIPNGILLQCDGSGYLVEHPNLLFPGKDDKGKDPKKIRARVSFKILKNIASWRVRSVSFQ